MKVLIVEDEALLSKRLQNLLQEIRPEYEVCGITRSVRETTDWLKQHPEPDLIFMDIELGDGKSFEIFNKNRVDAPVIFTTAYDEYAIQAFKVNSIDYLLKPINKEELSIALRKFERTVHASGQGAGKLANLIREMIPRKTEYRERFLVKKGQKWISVEAGNTALFMVSHGVPQLLSRDKQKYILAYTLEEIENQVDPDEFFRANRQFLISRQAIKAVHPWFNSKLKVEMEPDPEEEILVSRERAKAFKTWLGE
ncbi:MAG TPA: LytTR family DNA-binding domain-containing protein [Saprospiraceae bacterium]|nr:LytTR family DNA-binding domain-containing protein [Saprospiraceae bacterium]HNT22486.1 LytTR family DNA-binding domain-containing protein [Saprospiraceae bacterium]